MNSDLKIRDMTDEEIISLVEMCSYMFGVHRIADGAVTAFGYMLKSKFPLMRGEKIIHLCTDAAANQGEKEIKFTPSVLANILYVSEKPHGQITGVERTVPEEEKVKHRQQFLKDLSADFELYKHGEETKNIITWDYVARQLVSAGYAEKLPEAKTLRRGNEVRLSDIFSGYKPFVLQCFDKMIKNNQHISQIIHSIN